MYWWRDNSQTVHLYFALSFASILTVYSLTYTLTLLLLAPANVAHTAQEKCNSSIETHTELPGNLWLCAMCKCCAVAKKKRNERNIHLESTHQRTNRKLVIKKIDQRKKTLYWQTQAREKDQDGWAFFNFYVLLLLWIFFFPFQLFSIKWTITFSCYFVWCNFFVVAIHLHFICFRLWWNRRFPIIKIIAVLTHSGKERHFAFDKIALCTIN